MIAELIPGTYDVEGQRVIAPSKKRHRAFKPTFPIGRYLTQPLQNRFESFEELRAFLATCRYVSDRKQFGRSDYWLPPEEFESRRCGDCDCFAVYAWRQLLEMGYPARFVGGSMWPRGDGHAWVTFIKDGHSYLLESLQNRFSVSMPRLSTLRYRPMMSVSFDKNTISFYEHRDTSAGASLSLILRYVPELLLYEARYWSTFLWRSLRNVSRLAAGCALRSCRSGPRGQHRKESAM